VKTASEITYTESGGAFKLYTNSKQRGLALGHCRFSFTRNVYCTSSSSDRL